MATKLYLKKNDGYKVGFYPGTHWHKLEKKIFYGYKWNKRWLTI